MLNDALPRRSVREERKKAQITLVPVALLTGGLKVVPAHVGATPGPGDDVILRPVALVKLAAAVDAEEMPYVPTVEVILGREHPRHVVIEDVLDRDVLEMADAPKLLNLSSTRALKQTFSTPPLLEVVVSGLLHRAPVEVRSQRVVAGLDGLCHWSFPLMGTTDVSDRSEL